MTPATFQALSLAPAKSIKIPTSKEKGVEMSEGLFHSGWVSDSSLAMS